MNSGVDLSATPRTESDTSGKAMNSPFPTRQCSIWAGAAFLLFYFPFLFGPRHTYIRIHDNLDSDAVFNTVTGIFFLHPDKAKHLLLGGNLPIYLVHRLDWPLSFLHLIPDRFLAYSLNDLIVRIVAFLGMFCLSRRIGIAQLPALLASLLFAFSISLTVFGLSIAAIPAVVYLLQEAAEKSLPASHYLLLFFLAWNSSLVMSGIFLLFALPFLRRLFFGKANRNWFPAYISYAFGLALGAGGLLFAVFAGPQLHRDAWILSGYGLLASVRTFFRNQFALGHWDFHHVSTPLAVLYISVLVAGLITRSKKVWYVVGAILSINLLYAVVHFDPVAQLRTRLGGLIKTFQFDRFYFLGSFLIIIGWVFAMSAAGIRLRRVLIAAIAVQLGVTFALTLHLQAPVMHLLGKSTIPSFSEHAKADDYRSIRNAIGEASTISVGLDPMAALVNNISVLDGEYSVYPLSYKSRFRAIIAKQLELNSQPYYDNWGSTLRIDNPQTYFDNWGSRLYTFVNDPVDVALNYCAAFNLGGQFVISRFELESPNLDPILTTEPNHLKLYSIRNCQ
jgi:hypothetical protein